jgi:hypothetical protein
MRTVFVMERRLPENLGTRALRMTEAMQPPVAVPAKGLPSTNARVARPEFANVSRILAVPEGSPGFRHLDARSAAASKASLATEMLNGSAEAELPGETGLKVAVGGVSDAADLRGSAVLRTGSLGWGWACARGCD